MDIIRYVKLLLVKMA